MTSEVFTIQGKQVPAIGLGTWMLSGAECESAVSRALELGYRLIDTAQDYRNEQEVGKALLKSKISREQVFLVDKLSPANFRYQDAIRTVQESLERLQTGYLDLLLLHWPNPAVPLPSTLEALVRLQEQKKICHIGLSNFPVSLVDQANAFTRIFCNEVEYHPYLIRQSLARHAHDRDYLLMAYSPLAKGKVKDEPMLQKIGHGYGKSPAQVVLRWLIQNGSVPIPKAATFQHIQANLEVFDFHLGDAEMQAIENLNRNLYLDPVSDMADEE